jgi:hypothetical protein
MESWHDGRATPAEGSNTRHWPYSKSRATTAPRSPRLHGGPTSLSARSTAGSPTSGTEDFQKHLVSAIDAVPEGTPPLPTLLAAFATAPEVIRPRDFLRTRSAVIAANPPLQERELIKLAALSDALAAALVRRGCDEQTARLATDAGQAVMRLASRRALTDEHADFVQVLAASASDLLTVAAEAVPRSP